MTEEFNGNIPIWQLQIIELNGTQHSLCGAKINLLRYIEEWKQHRDAVDAREGAVMMIHGHTNTSDRAEAILAITLDNISSMHAVHYC